MADIELNAKTARAILREGRKDHGDHGAVYEAEIPDDEDKMVEEAAELVEMAEEAQEKGQDHPAISKILDLAGVEGGGSDGDPEEPWDGYAKAKVAEIIKELPSLDEDDLSAVYEFEKANKNRSSIIEVLEEMGEEEPEGDEPEGEESGEPWNGYDEDEPKTIQKKILGMELEGVSTEDQIEFYEKILTYEQQNEDRARITALLGETIEELKGELDDSVQEESEAQTGDEEDAGEESDEDYLKREDLDEMNLEDLKETAEFNELDWDEYADLSIEAIVVKIADALGLEYEETDEDDDSTESQEEPEEEADAGVDGLDWETLEQLQLDELKDVIKEHDLGFRAGPKTDLDGLRQKIAEALGIKLPAPVPWRGYDSRKQDQILKKLPKLGDEELSAVFDYESENKERKGILNKLQEIAEERGITSGQETSDIESEEEGEEGTEGGEEGDAASEPKGKTDEESGEGGEDEPEEDEEAGREPDPVGEEEHHKIVAEVTERVEKEHLSVPQKPPKDVVELPFDLTELSDIEVRKMHSAFLSYYGRASYVAKIEKQLSIACKHIADDKQAQALAELPKIDEETGKEKTATQLKAEAERDPEVQEWRKRERKHTKLKEAMREDCAIYEQNIESLSREWTMRHEEISHSGGLSTKAGKRKRG